jgi:hypothetical protein
MFRAAHRSSSGALNCICILWFICPCGDRPLPRLSGDNGILRTCILLVFLLRNLRCTDQWISGGSFINRVERSYQWRYCKVHATDRSTSRHQHTEKWSMDLLLKASECIIWLCGVTLQGLDTVSTAETTSAESLRCRSGLIWRRRKDCPTLSLFKSTLSKCYFVLGAWEAKLRKATLYLQHVCLAA